MGRFGTPSLQRRRAAAPLCVHTTIMQPLAGSSTLSSSRSSRGVSWGQHQPSLQRRTHRSQRSVSAHAAANRSCRAQQLGQQLPVSSPPLPPPAAAVRRHYSHARGARGVAARAASAAADAEDDDAADNFYAILGVPLSASQRDIKRAYKALMKDFHPDLSGDEESTQFCILLNEIYDTLSDPERRATYDALSGFSTSSVNPFADTALPADQVFVDEYSCVGCYNCSSVCPRTFEMEDVFGRARAMAQGVDSEDKLQEAIDTCPVSCIYWVTAPQLSLLEATMAKMERVAVWALMSGGGSGRDVFTEASIAWEKRRAAAAARVQAEADAASIWNSWFDSVAGGSATANVYAQAAAASRRAAASAASASGSYDDDGDEEADERAYQSARGFEAGSKEGQRIAQLSAKAARASRQWKSWQALQRRSRQAGGGLLLTASSVDSE